MRRNLFGKRHYSHSQKVVQTGVFTVIFNIVILSVILLIAGHEISNVMFGDFAYAVNRGGVTDDIGYTGETIIDVDNKDVIDENEWISPKVGEQYGQIVCDKIGLNAALYYGDSDVILMKGVGQYVKSYFPGQHGMIVVGGHDSTYFSALSQLENNYEDCIIKVNTSYGEFEYEITGHEIVNGSDFEVKDGKEQLVLYTCYPFGEISENRTDKIVFYCDKVNGPVIGGDGDE